MGEWKSMKQNFFIETSDGPFPCNLPGLEIVAKIRVKYPTRPRQLLHTSTKGSTIYVIILSQRKLMVYHVFMLKLVFRWYLPKRVFENTRYISFRKNLKNWSWHRTHTEKHA